jgi:PAS domain S-box-containing protein/putative nucleotidyltransferase with HDIG domain
MAAPAEDKLASTVKRLALVFALVVTIALPAGYFSLKYSNLIDHVETMAQVKAGAVNTLASANPELWTYQLQRMEELLLRYPVSLTGDRASVRDAAGNVLLTVGALPDAPVLIRASPLYDSGRLLGQVEITHSYRAVLFGTLVAALLGLALGALVYATLLILPLRALKRMSVALDAEQAALRTSEERFRLLFDRASDGIMIMSPIGKLLAVNESFARMHGYSVEEMLAMSIKDLDAPETAQLTPKRLKDTLAGESVFFDVEHYHKDGHVFPLEVSASLVVADGETLIQGFHRDITKRKQAEQELRTAEEQFRGLVEQSIAGIYIVQDGKFAYVNPRFAEIRGFASADELIGRDPLPLLAEKDRATIAENQRRLLAGEAQSISYDFTALRKDGSAIEVGVSSTRATYHGRPAIIGMIQDISEKKRAEEQIQHYMQQLETAFMSTVEVATNLSEMRDPYTAGHARRVGEIAFAIGAELGFDARRQEGLRVAGYLHDIGKMTIPTEILSKPGKLSAIEFQLIQGHAQAGYDVLKDVEFPWPVAQVALQHHERIDGSGYPQGLKGDAILLDARILAVADVVEAMSSHRPYRSGLGIEKALAEIERGSGIIYDAQVAAACLKLFREQGFTIPA